MIMSHLNLIKVIGLHLYNRTCYSKEITLKYLEVKAHGVYLSTSKALGK